MSDQAANDPQALLAKAEAFLKLQEEVYAPIGEVPRPKKATASAEAAKPAPSASQQQPQTQIQGEQQNKAQAMPQTHDQAPEPSIDKNQTQPDLTTSLENCKTLEELKAFCEAAEILKTDLENTRLVFGKGNPQADLLLIGEAPGAKEDQMGEPFVGASGNLLTKILGAIKVDRSQIYIANILKHRPPDNRNPTADERTRSLPYLERQIDLIQPKLILCLGLISAQTLLQSTAALKDMRGSFYPYRGAELMVTYHPAALLRNSNLKRGTWEDVQTLRQRYDALGCKPELPPYL
ncbi:uracil-DNA glycosylase [Cyclonatronum proteinivorum]|nr:uracil-DNA glycosylase [Cyclonatronum proteinivorum]